MDVLENCKFKDASPYETINRIRSILDNLGILTIENWENSVQNFYSVRITIVNTDIGVNGKGTSYEYALASAYGELMERIQNLAAYKFSVDLSDDEMIYNHFFYTPDEKYISINDLINKNEIWLKIFTSEAHNIEEQNEILFKWSLLTHPRANSDFVAIPFLNITKKHICDIPIQMIESHYGTNGMAAGNTPEEALVQGISEILERHVNRVVIENKIVPPTIPKEYIMKYPLLANMIDDLEKCGNYQVVVKDCSLGEDFPVICVILIDRDLQTYYVKFGAHPAFNIALERCLTELLQGKNIKNPIIMRKYTQKFSYLRNIVSYDKNFASIIVDGAGNYPNDFFSHNYSYEFKEFKQFASFNNKVFLKYLINLLELKGYEILVRDVSFLGFPSYHIIIPYLSEIFHSNINRIEELMTFKDIKKIMRNIENASSYELDRLIDYIAGVTYDNEYPIFKISGIPFKNNTDWYRMKKDLLISAAYYKKGQYYDAYKAIDRFIGDFIKDGNKKNIWLTYYKCIRDFFGGRSEGDSFEKVAHILQEFYPNSIVNSVIKDLNSTNGIFKYYNSLKCWECSKCNWNDQCYYGEIKKLHRKIKDKYARNVIKQEDNLNKLYKSQ